MCLLLALSVSFSAYADEGVYFMSCFTDSGNDKLINLGGSVYYLEKHRTLLFGDYSILFRIQNNGDVKRIKRISSYADFEGGYDQKILLSLIKLTISNYPTEYSYILFDPYDGSFTDLPAPFNDYLAKDDLCRIRAIDDMLFLKTGDELLYYSPDTDSLLPVVDTPIQFIGYGSTYLFIKTGGTSYYVYGIDGHVQLTEVSISLESSYIMVPNTHQAYYCVRMEDGCEIHQTNMRSKDDIVLVGNTDGLTDLFFMLSIDEQGQFLYYSVKIRENEYAVQRFDLQNNCTDAEYRHIIKFRNEKRFLEFLSGIIICGTKIVYVINDSNGNKRIVID